MPAAAGAVRQAADLGGDLPGEELQGVAPAEPLLEEVGHLVPADVLRLAHPQLGARLNDLVWRRVADDFDRTQLLVHDSFSATTSASGGIVSSPRDGVTRPSAGVAGKDGRQLPCRGPRPGVRAAAGDTAVSSDLPPPAVNTSGRAGLGGMSVHGPAWERAANCPSLKDRMIRGCAD